MALYSWFMKTTDSQNQHGQKVTNGSATLHIENTHISNHSMWPMAKVKPTEYVSPSPITPSKTVSTPLATPVTGISLCSTLTVESSKGSA